MIVRVSTFSSSSIACLSFLSWGRKASKQNRLVDLPEMISALMQAAGPGMGVTVIPASWHIRTSSSPGSEIPGVPASVISVTLLPASICSTR